MPGGEQNQDRVRLRVSGRVQGVGFRHFVRSRARSLGLRGWIRNDDDGSVVIVAEGVTDVIKSLEEIVSMGPRGARVDSVAREPVDHGPVLPPFEVRYFD